MKRYFEHYSQVPIAFWRWGPEFTPAEVACRGTGALLVDTDAMDALLRLRRDIGLPMLVTGYRSPAHNKAVGGKPASKHLAGEAFDVAMTNHDPRKFLEAAKFAGFRAFGHYPRSNFMHVDLGPVRSWTPGVEIWPQEPTRFSEPAKVREELSGSRTMLGGGMTGVGTAAAGAVDLVKSGIVEAQGFVSQVMPWLDAAKWVFLALALLGAGVAIYARWDDWKRGKR